MWTLRLGERERGGGGQDQHGTTHIDEGGQASNESKKVKCKSPTAREHTHTNTLSTEYVGKDSQHFFFFFFLRMHARTRTHAQTHGCPITAL